MAEGATVSGWDYVVFALMFVFSSAVGFYYAYKDRNKANMDNFHLGDRKGHPLPVALSLSVSIISATNIVGLPAEIYTYGSMIVWQLVGMFFAIVCAAFFFITVLYRLNKISVFAYIEMRFGPTMRYVSSALYVFKNFVLLSFVLYAPCLSFKAITGSSLWITMAVTTVVCTLYTLLGGIKAVVWTDTLQFVVMIAGLLTVVIIGAGKVGGFEHAWNIASDYGRIEFDNISADPTVRHTVWGLLIGYGFLWLYANGAQQATVQRIFTLPNLRQARMTVLLSYPGMLLISILSCMSAIVMVAYYRDCDPLKSGRVRSRNELFPLLVLDTLSQYPGLTGLVLASLFSGALSTISSGLGGVSAVFTEDLIKPLWPRPLSGKAQLYVSKVFVLCLGVSMFGIASGISQLDGLILQNITSVASSFAGPALGMYISGMVFPWTNKHGALAGLLISTSLVMWLILGKAIVKLPSAPRLSVDVSGCSIVNPSTPIFFSGNTTTMSSITNGTDFNTTVVSTDGDLVFERETSALDLFYSISYMWYTTLGLLVSLIVSIAVSVITGPTKPEDIDDRLMFPLFYYMCPFLPERYRNYLKFGIVYKNRDEEGEEKEQEAVTTINFTNLEHNVGTNGDLTNNNIKVSHIT